MTKQNGARIWNQIIFHFPKTPSTQDPDTRAEQSFLRVLLLSLLYLKIRIPRGILGFIPYSAHWWEDSSTYSSSSPEHTKPLPFRGINISVIGSSSIEYYFKIWWGLDMVWGRKLTDLPIDEISIRTGLLFCSRGEMLGDSRDSKEIDSIQSINGPLHWWFNQI